MKIKNPLDKDLSLLYKGENYVIEAGVSKEFPEDVVAQWISIYGFLKIAQATDKEKDAVVEAVEEKTKKVSKVNKAK